MNPVLVKTVVIILFPRGEQIILHCLIIFRDQFTDGIHVYPNSVSGHAIRYQMTFLQEV